jgi:hypothetical protein
MAASLLGLLRYVDACEAWQKASNECIKALVDFTARRAAPCQAIIEHHD